MKTKKIKLGIFGFGCVGQGLYEVLQKTNGIQASIEKICIKDPNKKRNLDNSIFTTDKNEILNNPEIDVVVELINDSDAAYEIVKTAIENGKAVVSASKKMIADHLQELYELQQKHKVPFLYEASCCASIPIIRNLEEYYDNDLLNSVEGIFNGTTNYILTKIFDENLDYENALKQAQEKGFAETDSSSDIEAFDPKYKLCILLFHAFGLLLKPENIFNHGIQQLSDFDIKYAKQNNSKIKLIAKCKKENEAIQAFVLPHLVKNDNLLFDVNNEYNGVLVESAFSENQFFVGKGAGGTPTGSAVLSDISALTYNYKYEYKKVKQVLAKELCKKTLIKVYVRYKTDPELNFNDFENISEKYQSNENKYIIGTIDLKKLETSKWLKSENVFVMVLN